MMMIQYMPPPQSRQGIQSIWMATMDKILTGKKKSSQLRILEVIETDHIDSIMSRTPERSHYHYYYTQIRHAKKYSKRWNFQMWINAYLGCRLVCLGSFYGIGLFSFSLGSLSKLGIIPKYDPIKMLERGTTSNINIWSNNIAKNELKLSIWFGKIRQSSQSGQSYNSSGKQFLN